tara:strand:+ start:75 stop:404 length:330 start_codon:yes stop_codon:yes gene_type:complete
MINNCIKNICLISFALFGPIYLPAGGIQKNLNDISLLNKSKEIILGSNCSIFSMPIQNSKELRLLKTGSSLLILRHWINSDNDKWLRVQLSNNIFIDDSNKPLKGWIKA